MKEDADHDDDRVLGVGPDDLARPLVWVFTLGVLLGAAAMTLTTQYLSSVFQPPPDESSRRTWTIERTVDDDDRDAD